MAGYARQSSSSIADGETITAAPLNSEFDAVLAAFAFSGGHNHDGSSTEGAYVGILADVDALNKIVVDTSNNRHGFFVEVSSSAVEQIRIQDGAIVPVTSNDIDLGTSSLQYKDIHIDGTAYIDTLEIHVGASLSAGVLSLPDGSASAPVITNTGDTNQGLYFSGTDEMSFTAGGTAQVTFADGVIKPVTDNDVDLGTSSLQFKDIHINGTANIDTLAGTTMSGNLAMGSNSITGLAAPSADGDAARKVYVDDSISTASGLTQLAGNINVNGYFFFGSSGEDVKFKPQTGASVLSTQDTDGEFVALVLRNESDAADTTGIASLRFDLEDTSGNTVDAAKIAVKKEASFTSTAATQDSSIVFSTSLNGTLTEYLKLTSAGILEPITDNTVDIGTSAKQIKDMYVHGTAYLDAIGFGTTSMTLPTADGSANQILKTDGSGTLSFTNDTGTTINNATENELVTVASTTSQLDGEANLTFDGTTLTLNGKLAMASNTAGKLLIADGTDFEPTAVGDLSEISSVASDDVLIALDTSGGGLKKITRANLVSGLATSSAITNVVEDTTPQLGGDLDAQGKDMTDVGILSADASAGIYGATGSPVVFTVTVASKTSAHPYNGDGSSSGYFLNGIESPALKLHGADSVTSSSGYYYKFDQAEGTNSGHPLRFYLDAAKTIAYTTGVTTSGTPGTAGAHTTIAVTDQTPSTLYYQCSSHGYMGNYASVDSANITSSGAVSIDAVGDVTIDADGGDIVFKDAGTTFGSATNTSGDLILKSGTTTALTFSGANATVAGNLVVTGNHTVNGTTTTVNSTTVTIDDPIFTLGGDGTPGSDDNKDRGIEFKYHTGSAAKVGFFGWDDSAGAFTFVPDATNSSEVFSGTVGNAIFGNITGTLLTASQTNITGVGALDAGSITSNFGTINTGSSNITTTGTVSGTNVAGTLTTAAQTNITSVGTIPTLTISTAVVPDASGGADLGSTSLEWGDLYIADDKKIYLGSDQDISIEYDEDGNNTTAVVAAGGVSFAPHGTGTGNGTELRFQELAANGANYVGFKSPDAISSNEVWVLPNADGSADQVLKTDGSNVLSWADAGGGGTVDKVADGAIAIRKPVILTSAGKAQEVAETTTTNSTPTVAHAVMDDSDTSNYRPSSAYESSSERYVLGYNDSSNSSYPTIVAGSWSNGTVTWGTPLVVDSNGISHTPPLASGDGYVFVGYSQGGTVKFKGFSISGTTFTNTVTETVTSNTGAGYKMTYIPSSSFSGSPFDPVGGILCNIYSHSGTGSEATYARSYCIRASNGTNSGSTTEESFIATNAHSSRADLITDPDNAKAIYATFDGSDGDVGKAFVIGFGGTASSPTDTIGTGVDFSGSDDADYVSACYDTQNNKAFIAFHNDDGSDKIYKGTIGTVNAGTNSIAFTGTATIWDFNGGGSSADLEFDTVNNKIIFFYRDDDNSDYLTYKVITPGASSFSVANGAVIDSSDNFIHSGCVSFGANKGFVLATRDANNSGKISYASAFFGTTTTTNLTASNYLGVSAAAISDTATGKIVVDGGLSEGHSSLSIGNYYFTTDTGAIATSGTQLIGKALTATEIQLGVKSGTVAHNTVALDANAKLPAVDGSQLTNVSVATGETFVAKGAIADKRLVGIAADGSGKVEEIFNKRGVAKTSSHSHYWCQRTNDEPRLGNNYLTSGKTIVYDPDTNRHIVFYIDTGDSYDLKANLGTVNTTDAGVPNGITYHYGSSNFGSDIDTGYHGSASYSAVYDTANNKLVVFYRDGNNSNSLSANVGTVTGGTTNTISWGSQVNISDDHDVEYVSAVYDANQGKCIVVYRGENNYLQGVTFTVSGTGGSFGSVAELNDNASSHINIAYNPVVQKSVVCFRNSSNYGVAKVVTLSGTTVQVPGNAHIFTYSAYEYFTLEANSDTKSDSTNSSYGYDEFLLTYAGSNQYLYAMIVSTSGNNVGSSTNTVITSRETRGSRMSYNPEAGCFVLTYHDKQDTVKTEIRFVSISYQNVTVSATGGDPDSTTQYSYYQDCVYDSTVERTIVIMAHGQQVSSNKHGWGWVLQPPKEDNHDTYIGVASGAASDGANVLVKTLGQVAEIEKTDMNVGISNSTSADSSTSVYLNRSSTATAQVSAIGQSDNTSYTLIGRAITSSKMIVAYNFGGAGHDDNYQVQD